MNRCYSPLPDLLRNEKKIIHVPTSNFWVNDGPRERVVLFPVLVCSKKSLIDSFFQNHVSQLGLPIEARTLASLFDEIIDLNFLISNLTQIIPKISFVNLTMSFIMKNWTIKSDYRLQILWDYEHHNYWKLSCYI